MQRNAKSILKEMGHIVFAHKEFSGDIIEAQLILKIFLNVGDYALEKRQLIASRVTVILVVNDAVDGKDQVAKADVLESISPISVLAYLLKKAQKLGLHQMELGGSQMVDVFVKSLCLLHKIHVVHRF